MAYRIEPSERIYDSLNNFIGENKIHKGGDVLYVSTRDNDIYDVILLADGVSTFRELYNGGSRFTGNRITVREEDEGQTLRVIVE